MCRLVRMDAPKVKYSIKELRYWLGASTMDTHKLANWSAFKRRALVESIDEINCIANFSVEMRPQAERWRETVGAVIFALKIGARSKYSALARPFQDRPLRWNGCLLLGSSVPVSDPTGGT